jgi:hypothetical protein
MYFNRRHYARVQMDANGLGRDTQHNTCATSYVTVDNSRPMAYLKIKIICK